jgi:Transposase IS66 family
MAGEGLCLFARLRPNSIHIDRHSPNAAEQALRAVALGRKNFLFVESDRGGDRAAAIQPHRLSEA